MAQNKLALTRYLLIDRMLSETKKGVELAEIIAKIEDVLGYRVSKRTIQLDLQTMRYDSALGFSAPITSKIVGIGKKGGNVFVKNKWVYFYSEEGYSVIDALKKMRDSF